MFAILFTISICIAGTQMSDDVYSEEDNTFKVDNLSYRITSKSENTIELIEYVGFESTLEIPSQSTYNGITYTLTSVANLCFNNNKGLTSVHMPDSVTKLGDCIFTGCDKLVDVRLPSNITKIPMAMFERCSSLTSIELPNTLDSIGEFAFCGCVGLTSVTIPNSVTMIGWSSFEGCSSLKNITIPDNVTEILHSTFSNCSALESATVGKGTTSIDTSAFYECAALTSIVISDENTKYASSEGMLFSKDKSELYICPAGISGTVRVPDETTNIIQRAFWKCKLLTIVEITNFVTSIGNYAFEGCDSLKDILVDLDNTTYASMDGVLYTKDMQNILRYPSDRMGSYTLPDSVKTIGKGAFEGSKLTEIKLESIRPIEVSDNAFLLCAPELKFVYGDERRVVELYEDPMFITPVRMTDITSGTWTGTLYLTVAEVPPDVDPEPSVMDTLSANIITIVVIIALIGTLVALVILGRKR